MQEKLIIYLRSNAADPEQPGWAVVEDTGQVRQSVYKDSPDGLSQLASHKEIIVIVPAEDVLLAAVTLPKMSRSKLLQAIPFALEEQLIEDVEALHFAVSDYHEDGSVSVAVVAKAKMQQWMSLLQSWHIVPDAMIPMTFAIPFAKGVWHVLLDDTAAIRSGLSQGFGCDKENLETYLNLALSSALPLPEQVYIHNYGESFPLHLAVETKEVLFSQDQLLDEIACQIETDSALNLLQGAFVSRKKTRMPKLNNAWKAITYLTAVLALVIFIYPAGSFIMLKRQDSELSKQIAGLYLQHFPGGKSIVAPRQRMEDKLHQLQGAMGDSRLLLLLGSIGKGLSQTSGINLKRFDFQNNVLTIEVSAANSEDFTAFNSFLTQQGLQVKQQNATLSGERVNATLQIE